MKLSSAGQFMKQTNEPTVSDLFRLTMSAKNAHETCEEIIKKVCASKLNYTMNQTPYSVYLTIRKKYVKEYEPEIETFDKVALNVQKDALENENNLIKHEYKKLYQYYQNCLQNNTFLQAELEEIKTEKNDLESKLKNRKVELEQIKTENNEHKSEVKKQIQKKKNNKKVAKEKTNFMKIEEENHESDEDLDFEPNIPVKNRFEGLSLLNFPDSEISNFNNNNLIGNSMVAPTSEPRTPLPPPKPTQCSPSPRSPQYSPSQRTPQGSPIPSTPPASKPIYCPTTPKTPPCSPSSRTLPSSSTPRVLPPSDEPEAKNNVFDLTADEFGKLLSGMFSKYNTK